MPTPTKTITIANEKALKIANQKENFSGWVTKKLLEDFNESEVELKEKVSNIKKISNDKNIDYDDTRVTSINIVKDLHTYMKKNEIPIGDTINFGLREVLIDKKTKKFKEKEKIQEELSIDDIDYGDKQLTTVLIPRKYFELADNKNWSKSKLIIEALEKTYVKEEKERNREMREMEKRKEKWLKQGKEEYEKLTKELGMNETQEERNKIKDSMDNETLIKKYLRWEELDKENNYLLRWGNGLD